MEVYVDRMKYQFAEVAQSFPFIEEVSEHSEDGEVLPQARCPASTPQSLRRQLPYEGEPLGRLCECGIPLLIQG